MKKADTIRHWRALPENQPLRPASVPYKHEGSTYGEDSIRITGSREFIDAVLSRVKPLLDHENGSTRLQLAYAKVEPKPGHACPPDAHACYIQVHERGGQAQMMAAVFGDRAVVSA